MTQIGNNGTGKSDYYGTFGTLLDGLFTGEVASGLDVVAQGTPNMTVKVNSGTALIPTGSGSTTSASLVRNDSSSGVNVTIATANGSNPRKDIIVAYYDVSVIDGTNPNNPGSLIFASVAGTPNATPADPSDSTIQAAVGASNPWIKLARVLVGTSVTQITNSNITDLRTMVSPEIADGAVTASKLDASATGHGYLELARTTLASAGDVITVSSFPVRKYLLIKANLIGTGGTIGALVTFNNDTGTSYTNRFSANGAADSTNSGAASLSLAGNVAETKTVEMRIVNAVGQERAAYYVVTGTATAGTGAGGIPNRNEGTGKWTNTATAITRIDITNGGTGNYAIGSEVVVMGHD